MLLRCLEGEGSAQGTYVFLRGFNLPGRLRVAGLQVYSSTRRLEEAPAEEEVVAGTIHVAENNSALPTIECEANLVD